MSASFTISYDVANAQATAMLRQLIASGFFQVKKHENPLEVYSAKELSSHTCSADEMCDHLIDRTHRYFASKSVCE